MFKAVAEKLHTPELIAELRNRLEALKKKQ